MNFAVTVAAIYVCAGSVGSGCAFAFAAAAAVYNTTSAVNNGVGWSQAIGMGLMSMAVGGVVGGFSGLIAGEAGGSLAGSVVMGAASGAASSALMTKAMGGDLGTNILTGALYGAVGAAVAYAAQAIPAVSEASAAELHGDGEQQGELELHYATMGRGSAETTQGGSGPVADAMKEFREARTDGERMAAAMKAGKAAMEAWGIKGGETASRLGYDPNYPKNDQAYVGRNGVVYLTKHAFEPSPSGGTPGRFGSMLAHEFEIHGVNPYPSTKAELYQEEVQAHSYNIRPDQLQRFGLTNDSEFIGAHQAAVNMYRLRLGQSPLY